MSRFRTTISYQPQDNKGQSIGGEESIVLDASLSETHTGTVDVAEHATETPKGKSVTADRMQPRGDTLSLDGIVTNTPVVRGGSPTEDRVKDAYAKLLKLKMNGWPAKVSTSLRTYENMVMTSLSVSRSAEFANALKFSASFREILAAAAVLPTNLVAGDVTELGSKTANPADAALDSRLRAALTARTAILAYRRAP